MINRAVFLDLQGTLGGDGLGDVRDFSFFPSAIEAIKNINDLGLFAVIITNQSHISKGLLTMDFFNEKMNELRNLLVAEGASIDGVYCCPHSSDDNCRCKKPLPGLVNQAKEDFGLDLERSYFIGDAGAWDIVLGKAVRCKSILVRTGLGESSLKEYKYMWPDVDADHVAEDVLDAVRWIIDNEKAKQGVTNA